MQSPLLSGCSAVRTPVLVIGQPLSFPAPHYLEFLLLDFPVCPSCLSKRLLTRFGYKLPPVDDLLFGRIVRFFHSFHSRQSLREVAFCFVSVHNGACTCWNSQPEEGSLMRSEEHTSELQSRLHLVC